MAKKKICEQIIEEAMCRTLPAQDMCNAHQKNYSENNNDDRELLLDDVTEVLNEIYQTLMKDYKLRFKKP